MRFFRGLVTLPLWGASSFRVAIVGDMHGAWLGRVEAEVMEAVVKPDLFLAVGDFENEDAAFVEAFVASTETLSCETRVMLGNHDAWMSSKTGVASDGLKRIVAAVADVDVGYRRDEVSSEGGVYSVVGGRPLSWGGGLKATTPEAWRLLDELYGVGTPEESTDVVTDCLLGSVGPTVVLAHQGPSGLGSGAGDICGRDWTPRSADFGDDDLRHALDTAKRLSVPVPLCVFGHMHSGLSGGGRRTMVADVDGTLFVNAAEVPRHRKGAAGTDAHFTVVDLDGSRASRVVGVWVNDVKGLVQHEVLWPPPRETPRAGRRGRPDTAP